MKFNELDMVRTLKEFPEYDIKQGELGVVLIAFTNPNEAYEVEFDDGTGKPKATLTLLPNELEKM